MVSTRGQGYSTRCCNDQGTALRDLHLSSLRSFIPYDPQSWDVGGDPTLRKKSALSHPSSVISVFGAGDRDRHNAAVNATTKL